MSVTLITPPKDKRLMTSWFQPSDEVLAEQDRLLATTFYLVKQGASFGERLRCTRCGNRHDYITLMCIEKPITGLYHGLYAYYRAIKDNRLEANMSPPERNRLAQIEAILQSMPDLSKLHPQLAREVTSHLESSDMQIGAVSFGVLEGISPTHAFKLVAKINDRGIRPKYRLGMPTEDEKRRAQEYRAKLGRR